MYAGRLSETAQRRLHIMRDSNDGFRIAEEDLRLRGPGEWLGTRQTGDLAPDGIHSNGHTERSRGIYSMKWIRSRVPGEMPRLRSA